MRARTEANGPAFHIPRKLRLMALLTALPLALFAKATFADRIVLENGDTLSGTVVKLQGGKLTLKTDYTGSIEIESGKVKSIVTDQWKNFSEEEWRHP